jgi:hypothetical protein
MAEVVVAAVREAAAAQLQALAVVAELGQLPRLERRPFRVEPRLLRLQGKHQLAELVVAPDVAVVVAVVVALQVERLLDVVVAVERRHAQALLLHWLLRRRRLLRVADRAAEPQLLHSPVFHSSDQRPMETSWSRGTRSLRKKHGADRQIPQPVITRAEHSPPREISCLRASRVACWLSKPIPASRF